MYHYLYQKVIKEIFCSSLSLLPTCQYYTALNLLGQNLKEVLYIVFVVVSYHYLILYRKDFFLNFVDICFVTIGGLNG